MEAFEKIAIIQSKGISEFGDPRDREPPVSDFIRSKKADCEENPHNPFSENSLISLNEIEQLYLLGKIPKSQSPTELLIYHNCWNYIKRQKADSTANFPGLTKSDLKYRLREEEPDLSGVILATAFTGDMNARAIAGANNTTGILFESDLTVWSSVLAYFITKFSYVENFQSIEMKQLDFREIKKNKGKALSDLCDFIINTVLTGSSSVAATRVTIDLPQEVMHSMVCFQSGFNLFSIAHEHSHLTRKHTTRMRDPDSLVEYMPDLREAGHLFRTKYSERRSAISQETLVARVKRQSFELEADIYGICYAFASFNDLPHPRYPIHLPDSSIQLDNLNTDLIFYYYGLASVLWTIEIVERISGILKFGSKYSENDIISLDFTAQNLLLRDHHPCPIHRMNHLIALSGKYELASNMVTPFFLDLLSHLEGLATDLHEEDVRPHAKWTQNSSELHNFFSLF